MGWWRTRREEVAYHMAIIFGPRRDPDIPFCCECHLPLDDDTLEEMRLSGKSLREVRECNCKCHEPPTPQVSIEEIRKRSQRYAEGWTPDDKE